MIVPLKKILEKSNYYISAKVESAKQKMEVRCSWADDTILLHFRDYSILTSKVYTDMAIRNFCKKYKYPYDYVLWFADNQSVPEPVYPLIVSEENTEKIENLWSLYHNMITEGLTPELVDLARESGVYSEFYQIIISYFGFSNV
jgi:hypothetical protein